MFEEEKKLDDEALEARISLEAYFTDLTKYLMSVAYDQITISEDTRYIMTVYKSYNEELTKEIEARYPISKIVRLHMHWKTMKLAGAFAMAEGEEEILPHHYTAAIGFSEMLNEDMMNFEAELVKEPYEVFCDYMHSEAVNDHHEVSLHLLRKLGYIPTQGSPTNRMKELVALATSYDKAGIYKAKEESITFDAINFSDLSGVSYVQVSGSKETRAKQCESGYTFEEVEFADLAGILEGNYAYCPFKFKDGKRSKAAIESGCKWICLDIDDSNITDEECHFILQDINHHIARTSDPNNEFKFRILLELDAIVDIPDIQWKHFIRSICTYLNIKADILPKSQIYFSYEGRNIFSVTDALPLESKDHIMMATSSETRKESEPKRLTAPQKSAMLDDPLETFNYAFECTANGSVNLIRAAYHAKDLGATKEEVLELMRDINDFWVYPLEERRFQNTILTQIDRWDFD